MCKEEVLLSRDLYGPMKSLKIREPNDGHGLGPMGNLLIRTIPPRVEDLIEKDDER